MQTCMPCCCQNMNVPVWCCAYYYLEPVCSKKRQKKSKPRNWFGEWGTSEGFESFKINLVSLKTSRSPQFPKPFSWLGLFFAVSYSKPALVKSSPGNLYYVLNRVYKIHRGDKAFMKFFEYVSVSFFLSF